VEEYDSRDIETCKLFKESSINIKLPHFKGYYSSINIYEFQNDFEKLHLRRTPRKLLPDLLKNNYLEEPALSIVKNLDDMDTIWERLKSTYGSPKTILQRKLNELSNINQLYRNKDGEKIVDGLSKLISMMKNSVCNTQHRR